ncbi:unnamed protein product, partial [marine sediment metagenome]
IDEVRIYNRSLTASEVMEAYNHQHNDSKLLLWMPFNGTEGNVTTDFSGLGNNGECYEMANQLCNWTTYGRPLYTKDYGRFQGGFQFNGIDDYVGVCDDTSLNFGTGNLSIEAWINSDTWVNQGGIFGLGANANSVAGYMLRQVGTSGLQMIIGNGTVRKDASKTGFSANVWYHVAGVVDRGNTEKLYVNGIEEASVDVSTFTGSIDKAGDKLIGLHVISYFNGTIDEVRVYNRTLTPAEINWSAGIDVQDLSGFGNTGKTY